MLNKITIFFLIIFNLIIFKVNGNEQISFDVTEIEILENGNKIIGKNRGTITTNNNIVIEADKFEFDKIKNFLKAEGNIIIKDEVNKYNFSAEDVLYFINEERIELKGYAEAFVDNSYNFKSENIKILKKEMLISSDVGATILDNINNTQYEIGKFSYSLKDEILKGENIFINTNYNQPFSDKYFFKSAVFNLKNQTPERADYNKILEHLLFSSCLHFHTCIL